MLGFIVKFFKSLNTNSHPGEIAHAVSIAVILGFLPKNFLWYILFAFFLFVRINKGALFLMILVTSACAFLLDPLFHAIGYKVLLLEPLKPFFAYLLNIPFVAFTRFNNTIVAGALVASLVLYIPVYIITRIFIKIWRNYLAPKIQQSKFIQALYKVPIIQKIVGIAAQQEIF